MRSESSPSPEAGDAIDLARALRTITERSVEPPADRNRLAQLNRWFEIALDNMGRGLSMFDAQQRLIVCNRKYREIYELPEALTEPGTPLAEIVRYHFKKETGRDGPEDLDQQRKWMEAHVAQLATGKSFSHAQQLANGRTILVSYQPLPDGGWVDVQEDITERRRATLKIAWLVRHDTLTGASNRFHFREHLAKALKCAGPDGGFAVHLIDLDRFKAVNDTLGHPTGDALLKSVAERLRLTVRESDIVARLGGDEFGVIQRDAQRADHATSLADRIINAVAEPHALLGHEVTVGASIGIAMAPEHGVTIDELLRHADLALYVAKSSGRGVQLFVPAYCESPESC